MRARLAAVFAAVVSLASVAVGAASYPELSGELGVTVGSYDLPTGVVAIGAYLTTHFPKAPLDGRAANELAQLSHRTSSVTVGTTSFDYDAPVDASKRSLVASIVDFEGRNVGLTAAYGSGGLGVPAVGAKSFAFWSFRDGAPRVFDTDEYLSLGVIADYFPGIVVKAEYGWAAVEGAASTDNSQRFTLAVGHKPAEKKLWLEAGFGLTYGSSFGDDTDLHVAGTFYRSDAFGLGVSLSTKIPDEGDVRMALSIVAALSQTAYRVDVEVTTDFGDGRQSLAVCGGYRF